MLDLPKHKANVTTARKYAYEPFRTIIFLIKIFLFLAMGIFVWPVFVPSKGLSDDQPLPVPRQVWPLTEHPEYLLYSVQDGHTITEDALRLFTSHRPAQTTFLCKLNLMNNCYTRETAELIEFIVSVTILYSFNQGTMPLLYEYTSGFNNLIKSLGMKVILLEAIRSDVEQSFVATSPNNEPWEIQTFDNECFFKRENLVNVVANKINGTIDWEYLIWVDPHQFFDNTFWWDEAIVKMAKYNNVQLFQYLATRNVGNVTFIWKPYAFNDFSLVLDDMNEEKSKIIGNAWGARREIFEAVGGLPDTCLSGCCDCAYALGGTNTDLASIHMTGFNVTNYFKLFNPWIEHARTIVKQSRAYVRGALIHLDHERAFSYKAGMTFLNDNYDRYDWSKALERDQNKTLRIIDPELKAYFKLMTVYAHFIIKD